MFCNLCRRYVTGSWEPILWLQVFLCGRKPLLPPSWSPRFLTVGAPHVCHVLGWFLFTKIITVSFIYLGARMWVPISSFLCFPGKLIFYPSIMSFFVSCGRFGFGLWPILSNTNLATCSPSAAICMETFPHPSTFCCCAFIQPRWVSWMYRIASYF